MYHPSLVQNNFYAAMTHFDAMSQTTFSALGSCPQAPELYCGGDVAFRPLDCLNGEFVSDQLTAYVLGPNQAGVVAVVGGKNGKEYEACPKDCL